MSASTSRSTALTLISASPGSGPIIGGTTVILTGTNLTGATAVGFGTIPATSFTIDSATRITAVSPAATGVVHITVTTPSGQSNGVSFTYVGTPPPSGVNFGPGTSIVSDGGPPCGSWGTVGAVGYDELGNLVALTAGHMMTRSTRTQEVFLTGNRRLGPIGYYATWSTHWPGFPSMRFPADSSKDYAVIKLDETKINPVNTTPNGTVISRIGTHPVPLSDIMCKYGQVSGTTCGLVIEYQNNVISSWAAVIPGDSGGPVTTRSGLVGITSAINPLKPWAPFQFTGIHGILDDIAAQGSGTIGIGFTPLP
ncbi:MULTISPECIES: IPT/TIG domain-containing protein [Nocardia]|uniref:IPT/TIG domain-containing protein n=1 Tax=Nocardia abscessus TaxID=120957 RepID=UPI001894E2F7|nr:IPT/TIG domain-containing protein [Nocardia abscessus]MBF6471014.1 IPT/TIG domain-containing protein [Nocardia abscessus]